MENATIRLLDFTFALIGLLLALPLLAIIYIIGLADTGSPIFAQSRVGLNERPFTLLKFRTMAVNTASVGSHLVDSSAVTRFGSFWRRTKLDELPQLVNVMFGEMSLVGPRPCLENQLELIKERAARGVFSVRPGITGLAQIREIDMSTPRKLSRYDQLMIRKMNLSMYLCLIAKTITGKGQGDRVRSVGH